METLIHCPLCSSQLLGAPTVAVVSNWTIITCPRCSVGITNPRPTTEEIGQYYRASFFSTRPDARLVPTCLDLLRRRITVSAFGKIVRSIVLNEIKYRHDWTLKGSTLRRLLLSPLRALLALTYEPIEAFPPKPGRVLDIGFGRGEYLYRARRLGWDCHGVEVSPTSVAWGRQLGFKATQFNGTFQEPLAYRDGSFDLVSANSVLEHVHHPRLLIAEARRLLRPGGRVLIVVPNFDCADIQILGEHWRMWSPPQHLFHYRAANVLSLLSEYGFENPTVRYKVWYNPLTDKHSLTSIRSSISTSRYRSIRWQIRFGKRLAYLLGRRPAHEVAPGMAIEAARSEKVLQNPPMLHQSQGPSVTLRDESTDYIRV